MSKVKTNYEVTGSNVGVHHSLSITAGLRWSLGLKLVVKVLRWSLGLKLVVKIEFFASFA